MRKAEDTFEDLYDERVENLIINDDTVLVKLKTSNPANFIQFIAHLGGVSHESVAFNIRTTDARTGTRHPYFERHRASDLASRAIGHLELNHQVKALDFAWTKTFGPPRGTSDNYTSYVETLNELRNSMTIEHARRHAVLATWTIKKIALPNGFSQIGEVHERVQGRDSLESPTEIRGTMWRHQ